MSNGTENTAYFLNRASLQALLDILHNSGYQCVGPQLHDAAIVYAPIENTDQLPKGVRDHQTPGQYRVTRTDENLYFAWANGAQGLKPWVFASEETLWRYRRRDDGGLEFAAEAPAQTKIAFIGARACDIAALYIQDKHFLQDDFQDPYYASRRQSLVVIAVNCTHSAETCFCASTGDGPAADYGFDLVLTELVDGFIVQARSEYGQDLIKQLPLTAATREQLNTAQTAISAAAKQQQRSLPSHDLQQALFANLNHPQWNDVAERCLSCGNCTSVCPTCFCHSEAEHPALDGASSEHRRQWDSCFSAGHSYIHGVVIRANTAQRYRQWLTHKLGSWHEQYGRSGCVGCGRCISWCPVGIDITREVSIICGSKT